MKKNFGKETILLPMPVLVIATYDENNNPNAMTAVWGGIHDTNQIGICIAPEHKTAKNLMKKRAFTVHMGDVSHIVQCDYLGLQSGNDVPNKLEKAGLTTTKSEFVDAPIINEFPMCIECKVVSFDESTGCCVADIINISAEESVLTFDKIDPAKVQPITYDPINHNYIKLGDIVGKAFNDGKELI